MKLFDLYQNLTKDERSLLAKKAAINEGYLYQLANRWRGKRASIAVIQALANADERLSVADMVQEFMEPIPELPKVADKAVA